MIPGPGCYGCGRRYRKKPLTRFELTDERLPGRFAMLCARCVGRWARAFKWAGVRVSDGEMEL